MKKIILSLIIVTSIFAVSCKGTDKETAAADASAKSVDPSYAFGIAIGNSLKETGVEIDNGKFLKGLKDAMGKTAPEMTLEEAGAIIQSSIEEATVKKAEANKVKETEFFAENGKKAGIVTTASGLQYEILKEGTGSSPKSTDTIRVDYVGTLVDGTTFDSSIARGEPAEFPLDGVIPGWTEGIQTMKVGGKTKFYIPSKLAYGEAGAGATIAPNSTLVFEVDLLEIVAPAK